MSYSVNISYLPSTLKGMGEMSDKTTGVPRTFRGTKDYVGQEYNLRRWATDIISRTFEQFGFQPLETPVIELASTLSGKYGEEGEANWFRLSLPTSEGKAGLRYDHTVPLARVMAMLWNQFPLPFRRYVIGPVFRRESPGALRLRQFTQCDFDTVGTSNPIVDAEVLAINALVLSRLGFTDQFQIQVNDRRLLDAIAKELGYGSEVETMSLFRAWDKLNKQSLDEVEAYLTKELGDAGRERAFRERTEQLLSLDGLPVDAKLSRVSAWFQSAAVDTALNDLDNLINMVVAMGVADSQYTFNPLMARGLDYYTGPIFETFVENGQISITGGGRFDNLINTMGGPDLPATGSSFGLERLLEKMETYGITPDLPSVPAQIFAVVFDLSNEQLTNYLFETVTQLRLTGFKVEVYTGDSRARVGKQLDVANRKGIPIVLLLGENEMRDGTVTYKVLTTGEQQTISRESAGQTFEQYL